MHSLARCAVALIICCLMTHAFGCALAPFYMVNGERVESHITDEDAVIIWDGEAKREHFIRRATIDTKAPAVGFLVPTPQPPELGEADASIFDLAIKFRRPKLVPATIKVSFARSLVDLLHPRFYREILQSRSRVNNRLDAAQPEMQIISQQRVAGYDATVLAATDANALAEWIRTNGYAWTPVLAQWLQPYVSAGWKITAFKLAQTEAHGTGIATKVVRMSFDSAAPFFPYSEPPTQNPANYRRFDVTVLSSGRMSAALAAGSGLE